MKDYNDLHTAGVCIGDLETEPLDIACLNIGLETIDDHTNEYRFATDFCKTIRDGMIKSDIAKILSKRWDKPLAEVKEYLSVSVTDSEELLTKVYNFEDSFLDFREFMGEEGEGLGFPSIDESIGGVKRKEVVVLGAYSNHGKSFVASKIVAHRILHYNDNVVVFSMEMPRGQFLAEVIKEILHMNDDTLQAYMKTDNGFHIYEQVQEKLKDRLRIVDEPNKSVADMTEIVRLLQADGFSSDFIVYDHFHLIPGVDDLAVQNSEANSLKDFVKRFNCRLLMLAQFNEESQKSYGTKKKVFEPMITNIKGSNNLKAIADQVLLVWRPYYTDTSLDAIEREALRFITSIKIAKSRRTLKGSIFFHLEYNPETASLIEIVRKS